MKKDYNKEVFTGCYYEVAEQISKLVEGKQIDHYTIVKLQDEIENYIKKYGDTFNIDILEGIVSEMLEEKSYSNVWTLGMGGLAIMVALMGLTVNGVNIEVMKLVIMIAVFILIFRQIGGMLKVRRRYLCVKISIGCIKRREYQIKE